MKKFHLSETKFYQSLTNDSLAKTKFISLHKTYDKPWNVVIFYIVAILCLISAVIGITLTVLGHNDYAKFIEIQKYGLSVATPDITMFIYGLFFIVLTIIFMITLALFGNSTFNKKMHSNV